MSTSGNYLVWELRELLEDFDVVNVGLFMALIKRSEYLKSFKENIITAEIASMLRLSSLDYAKKKYLPEIEDSGRDVSVAYIDAYKALKKYVIDSIERLKTDGKNLPSNGVFASSIVLERLTSSFFSAHLLYRLGNAYEGHTVSRLILEQIAWAYKVYKYEKVDKIKATSPSKAISNLKKLVPKAGKLYGFLSKKTHLDYDSHPEFLRIVDGKNTIIYGHINFEEYAYILLHLADIFVIVWEGSQYDFLDEKKSVEKKDDKLSPIKDRPFLDVIKTRLDEIKSLA